MPAIWIYDIKIIVLRPSLDRYSRFVCNKLLKSIYRNGNTGAVMSNQILAM